MLSLKPLAGTEDFQSRTVDQRVDWPISQETALREGLHLPCPSAQGAVIGRAQRQIHQDEDGDTQPFGLTQRQMKSQAQPHARLDC